MDVDNKNKNDQSTDIGRLLVEARENLGLKTKDIAEALNLADEVIAEIEKNNFNQEFPTAFIRGYIKSYATKVGLDTAPMLNEFDRQTGIVSPSLKSVKAISSFDKKRKEVDSGHYLFKATSILIVIVFLSFAGWKLWERSKNNTSTADVAEYSYGTLSSDISNQLETTGIDQTQTTEQLQSTGQENSETLSTVKDLVAETNPPKAIILQQSSNEQEINVSPVELQNDNSSSTFDESNWVMTNLLLDFSAECWVKITDARGEILAEGVKVNGKHMPLRGAKPITVILGDPSAVSLSYENEVYDLSVHRAGRRAEIVLN